MTDLTSLIEKLEKATSPDGQLDAEVAEFSGIVPTGYERAIVHGKAQPYFWHREDRKAAYWSMPVTSSIDAAVSLAGRVLPGWGWGITHGSEKAEDVQGNVFPKIIPMPAHLDCYGYHRAPAIALILATLRALHSRGEA